MLLFASAYSDDSLIPLRFILLLDTEELVFVRDAVLSEVAALIALSPTPFGVRCFVHYVKDLILLCVARKVVGNEALNLAGACLLCPFCLAWHSHVTRDCRNFNRSSFGPFYI